MLLTMTLAEKRRVIDASFEAWNRSNLEALLELYDAECEWLMANVQGWPEKPLYGGHEGLGEMLAAWRDLWDDYDAEITELVDLCGDRLLIVASQRGRGRLSGATVEIPAFAQIVDFRNGLILRIDNYTDVDEARAVAGVAA